MTKNSAIGNLAAGERRNKNQKVSSKNGNALPGGYPIALVFCFLLAWLTGCATSPERASASARHFDFERDTFAYANGLVWEYRYDENGKWTTRRREPRPTYSQHCFVVSHSACQFFENAVFDPAWPKTDESSYRRLVRKLVSTSLRHPLPQERKIVFPGYADLRSFSRDHEALLQAECGGAWRCYFQRGNWRMIFPFSRNEQEQVAEQLQEGLQRNGVAVVHLVRFPQLSINHAVLMFDAQSTPNAILFDTYDPNEPEKPTVITFDRNTRTFRLPPNAYFPGGRVDVYPIYDRLLY
jgi:hypothetical protein